MVRLLVLGDFVPRGSGGGGVIRDCRRQVPQRQVRRTRDEEFKNGLRYSYLL